MKAIKIWSAWAWDPLTTSAQTVDPVLLLLFLLLLMVHNKGIQQMCHRFDSFQTKTSAIVIAEILQQKFLAELPSHENCSCCVLVQVPIVKISSYSAKTLRDWIQA